MLRTVFFGALLLLTGTGFAHAERICDMENRIEKNGLNNGAPLTIRGRIIKSYKPNKYGMYGYVIGDSCGEAYVGSPRPINCRGNVTVTGGFELEMYADLFGQIAVRASRASCK